MASIGQSSLQQPIKLSVRVPFRLPPLPGVPLVPRTFTCTYYDTEDYRLSHAGITFCYQSIQRKGEWLLVLPHASTLVRLEYSGSATSPPLQFTELLFVHLHGQTLRPLARLRTRQSGMHVQDIAGPLADVRVHTVTALDGRRVLHTLTEIEVTPAAGRTKALHRLEQTLRAAGATDGDPRPAVLQVLGLELRQPPVVSRETSLAAYLRDMLQTQVRALRLADPGTRLGVDPEELHQMRVATRRLRAYLRVLRPLLDSDWVESIRHDLAWLGGNLGPVRDMDVILQRFSAASALLPVPEQRAFTRLLAVLEQQRSQDRVAMLAALRSERYVQLLTRLEVTPDALAVTISTSALVDLAAAAFQRLRKAMHKVEAETSDAALHRIRIYGKRARYAAELVETVIGKPVSHFLQEAKVFQDLLGEHQDAIVAEAHLRRMLRLTQGTLAAFAIGRLVERMQESRQSIRAALPDAWKTLARRGQKAWAHPHRQ